MRIAVQTTAAVAIAALIGAPLPASSQAARLLGETDGAEHDTVTATSSAGPIVSPIHKKTGDLARITREAAQAAVAAPAVAKSTSTPIPADSAAEPAAATGSNAAPLGNQPADRAPAPATIAPAQGAAPSPDAAVKARVKIRKALA